MFLNGICHSLFFFHTLIPILSTIFLKPSFLFSLLSWADEFIFEWLSSMKTLRNVLSFLIIFSVGHFELQMERKVIDLENGNEARILPFNGCNWSVVSLCLIFCCLGFGTGWCARSVLWNSSLVAMSIGLNVNLCALAIFFIYAWMVLMILQLKNYWDGIWSVCIWLSYYISLIACKDSK